MSFYYPICFIPASQFFTMHMVYMELKLFTYSGPIELRSLFLTQCAAVTTCFWVIRKPLHALNLPSASLYLRIKRTIHGNSPTSVSSPLNILLPKENCLPHMLGNMSVFWDGVDNCGDTENISKFA